MASWVARGLGRSAVAAELAPFQISRCRFVTLPLRCSPETEWVLAGLFPGVLEALQRPALGIAASDRGGAAAGRQRTDGRKRWGSKAQSALAALLTGTWRI